MAFRGGRGGGAGAMGGFRPVPLDVDPDFAPSERYPKMIIPVQGPISDSEKEKVAQFFQLRDEIRDGPLFAGSSSNRGKIVVESDNVLNDGIKRYTDRYIKKRKIGRSVEEHPYVLSLFPAELYPVMGLKNGKSKKLDISKFTQDLAKAKGNDQADLINKLKNIKDDAGKADDDNQQDGDSDDLDDIEDDFDEDEDDDNDYNAEKYFDDGDDFGAGDDDDGEAAY